MHLTSLLLRTLLYRGSFRIGNRKNIMTTPRKMQEILEDLKGNPYYDKYAEKIKQLQQASPEQFSSRVEGMAMAKPNFEATKERQYSQLLHPKQKISPDVQTREGSLDKIMKIELIKDKSADEIKSIWEQYHVQKECVIAATIPTESFNKLSENSNKYPTFLLPLPRSQGYEFIMCQFEKNRVHFTPLLYFQVHKENAPECLTITHYTEFKDDKGIILMRGEFDKNIIDGKEAQCLANELQLYYVQNDEERRKLLETFTNNPDRFDHMDLVGQINNLKL